MSFDLLLHDSEAFYRSFPFITLDWGQNIYSKLKNIPYKHRQLNKKIQLNESETTYDNVDEHQIRVFKKKEVKIPIKLSIIDSFYSEFVYFRKRVRVYIYIDELVYQLLPTFLILVCVNESQYLLKHVWTISNIP